MDREKDARNQNLYPVCSQAQMSGCYEVLAPGMEGCESYKTLHENVFLPLNCIGTAS